uniref:(northern house mosquito) hypothetical protein n=1 Tax=Culex pipiens TaxID=7175 RepID=A0A8D8GFX4_CULPI
MSHSGSVDSETDEPGPDANTRHVYCAVLDRVLPGTEALHHLQFGVPGGRVSDLQQRAGKLHLLEQLRRSPVREWLRPRPSGGDDDDGAGEGREFLYYLFNNNVMHKFCLKLASSCLPLLCRRHQLRNQNMYLLLRARAPKTTKCGPILKERKK